MSRQVNNYNQRVPYTQPQQRRGLLISVYNLTKKQFLEPAQCQRAKLHAGIKPTALCSAFDKENSIEFLLDLLYYIYNYYVAMLLYLHGLHVTSL